MAETNLQEKYAKKLYDLFELEPLAFGHLYLEEHFKLNTPDFHVKMLDAVRLYQFLAVSAPRGSAKTSLLLFLTPMHWICFKKKHCIVMVGNTYKKAASQLENIKSELRTNAKLKNDFGIKITKDAEGDSVFTHPDGFETNIICKGADQLGSIRGEKFGAYRPDAILVDDVEEDVEVRSSERREGLRRLYDDALIPALDINSAFNVVVLGTILHDDALMARLVSDKFYPQYRKIGYQALNKDKSGKEFSLWPEKWTLEWLYEQRSLNPITFAREMQGTPISDKDARFKKEQFLYWEIDNGEWVLYGSNNQVTSRGALVDCKAAIACDLAWSERKEADSTVLLPGLVTRNGDVLIDNYISEQGMKPDKFANNLFIMAEKYLKLTGSVVPIGLERAMLEKVTHWILKSEMKKRRKYLLMKDLVWEADKITRIETILQPRYANGVIYHRRSGMSELEYQLVRFPSGTHDDIIDAEQGLVRLLEFPKGKGFAPKKIAPDLLDAGGKELNQFGWMRQLSINRKKSSNSKRYVFGQKAMTNKPRIPSTVAFR